MEGVAGWRGLQGGEERRVRIPETAGRGAGIFGPSRRGVPVFPSRPHLGGHWGRGDNNESEEEFTDFISTSACYQEEREGEGRTGVHTGPCEDRFPQGFPRPSTQGTHVG